MRGRAFSRLPTPDRYARASLSKHLLAHSRFTLLSPPQLYIFLYSNFRRNFRSPTLPQWWKPWKKG